MHVAKQLYTSQFSARIGGVERPAETLLPGWSQHSRFGLVVDEPLGGLGASLLVQLAIARFYDSRPDRRQRNPVYPEIYLFHAGGPHGDFSNFDFWPPRKELALRRDPLQLLESINAHAITHLALPVGDDGVMSNLDKGPSTWAEQASALDRLEACLLYAANVLEDGDVQLMSMDTRVQSNIEATLDPEAGMLALRDALSLEGDTAVPGPSVVVDGVSWAERVEARLGEVSWDVRRRQRDRFEAALAQGSGQVRENYRRISVAEALLRISGFGAP